MAQGQGYDSYAAIGVQSTLGTLVTRIKFFDIVSESVRLLSQHKAWNNAGQNAPRINTELGRHSEGDINVYGAFEGLESLFKAAFGASSVTSASINGSGYSHTFALKNAMPDAGLSLEIPRSVQTFLYEGVKIEEVEIIQNANDYLMFRFTVRGRNETEITATSPSFLTVLKIHQSQLVFKIATVATDINSFRLSLKNNLTGFRGTLGSLDTKEYIRSNKRSVTGSISLPFDSISQYDNFRALTNLALEAKWTGGTIPSSTDTYQFKLNLPQINWDGTTPTVPGPGPLDLELPFTAFETTRGGNDELVLYMQNGISSVA